MARKNEITVVSFMILEDGSTVPFEKLTEEQKQSWREACCRRLSTRLDAYYSKHPEEYAKL